MENQHRTQEEINLMNEIKELGVKMDAMHKKLVAIEPTEESRNGESFRWIALGKTSMQQGLMAWTRAVAKPEFF